VLEYSPWEKGVADPGDSPEKKRERTPLKGKVSRSGEKPPLIKNRRTKTSGKSRIPTSGTRDPQKERGGIGNRKRGVGKYSGRTALSDQTTLLSEGKCPFTAALQKKIFHETMRGAIRHANGGKE